VWWWIGRLAFLFGRGIDLGLTSDHWRGWACRLAAGRFAGAVARFACAIVLLA
jgi:hypothetical protein